jgi:hypothetical protein
MGAERFGLVVNTCIAVVFWADTVEHLDGNVTRIFQMLMNESHALTINESYIAMLSCSCACDV